jgi:hypothetical protein
MKQSNAVMAGLVPAIHVLLLQSDQGRKTWMPGTSPGMTIFLNVSEL